MALRSGVVRLIRVLIVDDDARLRRLLRELLSAERTFDVVAEAGTAEEGIRLACELEPDVVTMDGIMPGRSGIDATRVISSALGIPVVVVSGSLRAEEAIEAGAVAAVAKTDIASLAQVLVANVRGLRG